MQMKDSRIARSLCLRDCDISLSSARHQMTHTTIRFSSRAFLDRCSLYHLTDTYAIAFSISHLYPLPFHNSLNTPPTLLPTMPSAYFYMARQYPSYFYNSHNTLHISTLHISTILKNTPRIFYCSHDAPLTLITLPPSPNLQFDRFW